MEDRYEIRGKIGAGGLGTVYRGYDMKMKREVAIKRIMTSEEDPTLQEEATKQLAQEAGALASLQHPHIVTVYDVGQDEDGPYVVMELINGVTLDDIIEEQALTWSDFRELAMQTQEALIAAQQLEMIHSDLKPPNIMLTWLPSGKFQIKIVDFGLAMLVRNQSKEELATIDTVFGSIFFMPPEQFEREVLDARSDLYSMACVYYQCLTGRYPFTGEDGNEVMEAHLNHRVIPIKEIRAGVPVWVCDWVMWQLNRDRDDRPQSAREALAVFLQNDRQANPEMSTGGRHKAGPKLIIPGADAPGEEEHEPIIGQPIVPPGDLESVEMLASQDEEPEPEPTPLVPKVSRPHATGTIAPRKTQGLGRKQGLGTSTSPQPFSRPGTRPQPLPTARPPQPPMSTGAKVVIAIILGIAIVVVAMVLMDKNKNGVNSERLNELIRKASVEGTTELEMSLEDLEMILKTVASRDEVQNRDSLYILLSMAKANDAENFDIAILGFARGEEMRTEVRKTLIGDVLKARNNSDILTLLLDYANQASEEEVAVAAIDATSRMNAGGQAGRYIDIIVNPKHPKMRKKAEDVLQRIIEESDNRKQISSELAAAYDRSSDSPTRTSLIRLLGQTSTDSALKVIIKALDDEDPILQGAAVAALGRWQNLNVVDELISYLNELSGEDEIKRNKGFEALVKIGRDNSSEAEAEEAWAKIVNEAETVKEKRKLIWALAATKEPWVEAILMEFMTDSEPRVSEYAKSALEHNRKP